MFTILKEYEVSERATKATVTKNFIMITIIFLNRKLNLKSKSVFSPVKLA